MMHCKYSASSTCKLQHNQADSTRTTSLELFIYEWNLSINPAVHLAHKWIEEDPAETDELTVASSGERTWSETLCHHWVALQRHANADGENPNTICSLCINNNQTDALMYVDINEKKKKPV